MDKNKFYKIGEIGKLLDIPQSTLRYWESEFKQIKPTKSSGGQRFYSSKDIEILKQLKELLYVEKLTIEGAKKRLKENNPNNKNVSFSSSENITDNSTVTNISLSDIKKELLEIAELLRK